MTCQPHIAKLLTTCALILHNYERIRNPRAGHPLVDTFDNNGHLIKGDWRQYHPEDEEINPPNALEVRGNKVGEEIHHYLRMYFVDEARGAKPWQWEKVNL